MPNLSVYISMPFLQICLILVMIYIPCLIVEDAEMSQAAVQFSSDCKSVCTEPG